LPAEAVGHPSSLLQATLLLFIAVDPIGNAPLFYSLTAALPSTKRRRIIERSIRVAFAILVMFTLVGDMFLQYFGLTIADFRIAGGIILLIYGVAGILGFTEATMIREPREVESLAIVPLATPLLAGPAAIATVLYLKATLDVVSTLTAVVINTLITYAMLRHSDRLMEAMGENGAIALSKIMSILLAAIAVAMIRGGIEEAIEAMNAASR
jgi:multiple antibiotic resistance protein